MIPLENFPEHQVQVLQDIYQICLGIKSNKEKYININKAYTTIGAALFTGLKIKRSNAKGIPG
jgi:hypothetical protein